jgi:hypothetical protein
MATNDTLHYKRDEANKIVNEINGKSILLDNNLGNPKIILSELDNKSSEAKKYMINIVLKQHRLFLFNHILNC